MVDPVPRDRQRRARGVGTRRQRAVDARPTPAATSTRRSPTPRSPSTRRSRPSASSTRSSNRSRRSPCRPRRRRRPRRCTSTPAARASGTTATTSPRCSASTQQRITTELVSNGGAFGGKEDMSNQAHTALAAWHARAPGEDHAVARGVAPHAPEAPPDPDALRGRLRRRRQADGDPRPDDRRLRPVRVGRDEGARTRGRSRHRPVPRRQRRRRGDRGADQQLGLRRVPRVRRQPGAVRDGGRDRPARRAGRHQRLGDARRATS